MIFEVKLFEDNEICKIDKDKLFSRKLTDLLEYFCGLDIYIDGRLFFSEGVCPLELFHQYIDWYIEICKGEFIDFEYHTEDDGQNPILKISFLSEEQKWLVDSIFKKYDEKHLFSLDEIIDFFNQYVRQMFSLIE